MGVENWVAPYSDGLVLPCTVRRSAASVQLSHNLRCRARPRAEQGGLPAVRAG